MTEMTSSRPYLVRAFYEWIVDNGLTPLMLLDAEQEGVVVPQEHIEQGKIILNVAPTAVRHLVLENEYLTFGARFGGRAYEIHAPITAVLAIYARENGRGMLFEVNADGDDSEPPPEGGGNPSPSASPPTKERPKLRLVK